MDKSTYHLPSPFLHYTPDGSIQKLAPRATPMGILHNFQPSPSKRIMRGNEATPHRSHYKTKLAIDFFDIFIHIHYKHVGNRWSHALPKPTHLHNCLVSYFGSRNIGRRCHAYRCSIVGFGQCGIGGTIRDATAL